MIWYNSLEDLIFLTENPSQPVGSRTIYIMEFPPLMNHAISQQLSVREEEWEAERERQKLKFYFSVIATIIDDLFCARSLDYSFLFIPYVSV